MNSRIVFIAMCAIILMTACVSAFAESEMAGITTPEELWKGFDPTSLPLDVTIVKQWEQDGVVMQSFYLTSEIWKDVPVRVYGVYGYPKGKTKLPAVLHIHGGGGCADPNAVLTWAKNGYAAASFDHLGKIGDRTVYTEWGAVNSTATYGGWGDNPKNDIYYHAVIASMRMVTFLTQQPQVNPEKIGAYGISYGGTFIWMVSALDSRLKCVVPIVGTGIPKDQWGEGPSKNFYSLYSGVHYAPKQKCPVLFMNATNDFNALMDNSDHTFRLVNTDKRQVYELHYNHHIAPTASKDIFLWMDTQLKGGPAWPKMPELSINLGKNGIPSATVKPDASQKITGIRVCYNIDTNSGVMQQARYWRTVQATRKGKNWSAEMPIMDAKQTIRAYCDIYYEKGHVLSSLLNKFVPEKLGNANATLKPTTLIEDFAKGKDCDWVWWPCGVDPANSKANHLIAVQASDGVWGITGSKEIGETRMVGSTTKITDPAYLGRNHKALAFTVRCSAPAKLNVVMYWKFWQIGQTEYFATVKLPDTKDWTTLTVTPSDFKSKDGKVLENWDNIHQLRFEAAYPKGEPLVLSKVEWVD